MKATILSTAMALVTLFTLATASITLGSFPETVHFGQTYTLTWTATSNYSYTLWLIRERPGNNPFSWRKVQGLAEGLSFKTLNGTYKWTVPSNLSTESTSSYAIWLDAFDIPFDGGNFNTQTPYFNVSSATIPTHPAEASPAATQSAVTGGSSNTPHHSSPSGGAIAGIVIGVLVAIALVVGAGILFTKYRRRSAFKKREAEARANRLSSVMPTDSASYEMHSKGPQAKETAV